MKNNDNDMFLKDIQYEHIDSNAVLTPYLNTYSPMGKKTVTITAKITPQFSTRQLKQIKQWKKQQKAILEQMPSNAVLVPTKKHGDDSDEK